MATIVTRAGKGSPLTNNEVDANFENLNAEVTPLRHSIRPSLLLDFANSKQLDPRITFSRASTGTYYDGKTFAKAEENLVNYSEAFDSVYWTKDNVTTTANNTAAPDGTTTAELVTVVNGSSSSAYFKIDSVSVTVGGTATMSIYAKQGTASIMRIGHNSSTTNAAWFDLSSGTALTVRSGCSSTITSVGNGWYRCTLTTPVVTNSSATVFYGVCDTDASLLPAATGTTMYFWGAQIEQRDSVTAYTPTTSQPITNYIPVLQTAASGTARFDHDPVTGESKGLLIEEQRTNLALYSSDFSNWTNSSTTCETNVAIAPDGTLTADKIYATTSNTNHFTFRSCTTAGTVYTWSAYVKTAGDAYCVIHAHNINVSAFQFSTGTFVTTASGVTTAVQNVGDGWYRISMTYTASSGNVYIGGSPSTGYTYAGDGYSGIYIWGAQLEAGAFPTSYIKTTSAQATRNEDEAEMSAAELAKVLNVSEGTAYIAANFSFSANTPRFIATIANGYNRYMGFMYLGGVAYFQPSNGSINSGKVISVGLNKQAISWSGASSPVCYNATNGTVGSADTGTGVNTFVTYEGLNVLRFGNSSQVFGEDQNGWVTKFALYPKALSTSELQALTEE
jgi:hypothetical protein